MKITLALKERFGKAKTYVLENTGKVAVVGAGALSAGTLICLYAKGHKTAVICRADLEASGEKILETFGNTEVIEGRGPIWDTLRDIFSKKEMNPGEFWMVEMLNNGVKAIVHSTDSPTMEGIRIGEF